MMHGNPNIKQKKARKLVFFRYIITNAIYNKYKYNQKYYF